MTNKPIKRYTLNRDGTIEHWYLENDSNEWGLIFLRKTPRPKFNCCMKEFQPLEVYNSYREARAALKKRGAQL